MLAAAAATSNTYRDTYKTGSISSPSTTHSGAYYTQYIHQCLHFSNYTHTGKPAPAMRCDIASFRFAEKKDLEYHSRCVMREVGAEHHLLFFYFHFFPVEVTDLSNS